MKKVLDVNDAWAAENRAFLAERGIIMVNLIGSPGAGKTSLLEKTIELFGGVIRLAVIEGDIATTKDAERIHKKGIPVYQINTGTACHLDANLVNAALKALCNGCDVDCIFVENIGNLVCPAEFDIGEDAKVAVLSVTEGDDKVEKYPLLFSLAKAVVISKMGLHPHTNFDLRAASSAAERLNPAARVMLVDSLSGNGLDAWGEYLVSLVESRSPGRVSSAALPAAS